MEKVNVAIQVMPIDQLEPVIIEGQVKIKIHEVSDCYDGRELWETYPLQIFTAVTTQLGLGFYDFEVEFVEIKALEV